MACLPQSGSCERWRLDPLVDYLNKRYGTAYVHVACLDRTHRNRPQPEALYVDEHTHSRPVIEHKTILWPPDHAQKHQSDHLVAEHISKQLWSLIDDSPYELRLPYHISGTKKELQQFIEYVCNVIHRNIDKVKKGRTIGARKPGREWYFRKEDSNDRDYDESTTGLKLWWLISSDSFDPDKRLALGHEIANNLQKIFNACRGKFADYSDATRLLVLQLIADIYFDESDWARTLALAAPPPVVEEVWLEEHVWVTDFEQERQYNQLYPFEKLAKDHVQH